jgi:hypothetical protein
MKTITPINLYLIFIIIIIVIGIYYIRQNEGFEPQQQSPYNINIQDTSIKNIIQQSLTDLQISLERFSYLDAPITINDNGQTCMLWGNYNNGKFTAEENKCIISDNSSNTRKCLGNNGLLTSCTNLYSDGYIEKMNTINIIPLIEQAKSKILYNLGNANLDLADKNKETNKLISDLITQRNLENQQLYFINYNTDNITEKQKDINKINKNVLDKQTELNLNQVSFSQFIETNTINENRSNLYYKIIMGLIIGIIIIVILNILFTNIY